MYIETWEAIAIYIYRNMLLKFIESRDAIVLTTASNMLVDALKPLEITQGETENEFCSNFNSTFLTVLQKKQYHTFSAIWYTTLEL